ncbi:ATP-binding protein [Actinomadura sp. BRA 177]|uniref:ATP-binding protein n=1 Tax=Actinomadura sp. BRA 177 TaxID=2745202 RepID=UPI001595DD45|nr:ATP-binding protein [Actinomadura sp. BRA 177]NVI85761.1 HAMP domain-containing histidine kinase [Actinomadura sp. BRA 177]
MSDWLPFAVSALAVIAGATAVTFTRQMAKLQQRSLEISYRFANREEQSSNTLLAELISKIEPPNVVINTTSIERNAAIHSGEALKAGSDEYRVVREIAHSLNTPLSQIEAALELLASDEEVWELLKTKGRNLSLRHAQQSVDVCKAFILSYRQLSHVAERSGNWDPRSLNRSLRAAAELYMQQAEEDIKLEIGVDDRVFGYPNSFLLSVLLPLLENAIDAAITGSKIRINYERRDGESLLKVESRVHGFDSELPMYESGFTTKANHQGLGLSVVQRLLSTYKDARLWHEIDGDIVRFIVALPVREK